MREGLEDSLGFSEQGVPLMTAQEIKQLRDDQIIGFHRRLPAFQAKRMDWRYFPQLAKRRNIPPPTLSPLPQIDESIAANLWQRKEQVLDGYIDPDMIN